MRYSLVKCLALLASGDPDYAALVEREAAWASKFSTRDSEHGTTDMS